MLYFQRYFASALIVFVLLFSVCALPENISARSCPSEPPDSLLTLYLKSDLIVVASIESEKVLKMTSEYEYGSYFDVEKILDVSDTLKGSRKGQTAYVISQYEPKDSKIIGDESSKMASSEETDDFLSIGHKALFFLVKNAENNSYELADYGSAIKKLSDHDLSIYLKRIKELKKITEAKKNQLTRLTEWLVQLVEEPVTRDEGTSDLQASFMALEYERQESEEETVVNKDDKGANAEEEAAVEESVFPDKNFRAGNTSEIAKILIDSQKNRLSSVLSHSINIHLAKLNNIENEEEIMPDYELIMLVGHWNKTYLAMNSYAVLQNSGNTNPRKTSYLLNLIAYLFNDEKLFSIVSNYEYAAAQPENEMTEYPEEEEVSSVGEVSDAPVVPETSGEIQEAETLSQQTVEGIVPADKMQNQTEAVEKEVRKITFKQYKEILWDNFAKQYGIVIAQSNIAK